MRGIRLGAAVFAHDAEGHPHSAELCGRGQTRARRERRFEEVLSALDELIRWAKHERASYLRRLFGYQMSSSRRNAQVVQQWPGLPVAVLSKPSTVTQIVAAEPLAHHIPSQSVGPPLS